MVFEPIPFPIQQTLQTKSFLLGALSRANDFKRPNDKQRRNQSGSQNNHSTLLQFKD